MKFRVLIVDNNSADRRCLRNLLSAYPQIEIVGEAAGARSAAALCASLQPGLIFINVHLPPVSGFELLPLLTGNPLIVFVAAHERFAARAFGVNALDYLLKPIRPAQLALSIGRLKAQAQEARPSLVDPDLVAMKQDRVLRMMPTTSISHITAEDNYSRVHLVNVQKAFVRRSLAEWEKILPMEKFLRLDRSLIVQVAAIQSLSSHSRDRAELVMLGQASPLLLGRRAALSVRRTMEQR